jgi:type IV secretory pathway TraG/TraD family ATPase VirD4
LGSLIVSHLQLLTMARSDIAEQERVPFFVHVDELANFTTDSFASLLSEARKYGTRFAVAAQYTSQASDHLLDALLGDAGVRPQLNQRSEVSPRATLSRNSAHSRALRENSLGNFMTAASIDHCSIPSV